jgi:hypothetical protein
MVKDLKDQGVELNKEERSYESKVDLKNTKAELEIEIANNMVLETAKANYEIALKKAEDEAKIEIWNGI